MDKKENGYCEDVSGVFPYSYDGNEVTVILKESNYAVSQHWPW